MLTNIMKTTHLIFRSLPILALGLAALARPAAAVPAANGPATPPTMSSWTCSAWTGDADSGITGGSQYTVAVNCGGDAVTVNGVAFQASALSGANFLIEGAPSTASAGPSVAGDSTTLASDFIYGGNPLTVTLKNLTPGTAYETTFFSYGWDAAPTTRSQTFSSGGDSIVVDQNCYGKGNGIRITYRFVADAASKVFAIKPATGNTFHLSALANQKVTPATILSFGSNVPESSAVFTLPDKGAGAIAWTVPHGTVLAKLAPTFKISSGTCNRRSGRVPKPNFGAGPVIYTVTDGGITNVYTVSVAYAPPSTACDLKTFHVNIAGSRATLIGGGPNSGRAVVNVPAGATDAQLAARTPALTLSPHATCVIPAPPLRLNAPVHYIVTAQDGISAKDYTVTVSANAEAFRLFIVKISINGLSAADYDYLGLIPAAKHINQGAPAIFTIADERDLAANIYLQDYLRRYRPTAINTINFSAAIPNFTSSAVKAAGPLELSVAMATGNWKSSGKVVLVSDAVNAANYPNVLQASALAAALDAPLLYYNSAKTTLVQKAITRLGATEVIYVNAAGTKPALATLVLTNPATIVNYLAGKNIKVDYFAVTNPRDLVLISGAKLSLTAPFVAARRTGIVVPVTSPNIPTQTTSTDSTDQQVNFPTWAGVINDQLKQLYQDLGRYPAYLALVGNAASIPLHYYNNQPDYDGGNLDFPPTDLDYANVDADPFPDIAVGRIMAYNVFDATLLTCRISTYGQLFDGTWEDTYAQVGAGMDENHTAALMTNSGFAHLNLLGVYNPSVEAGVIGNNFHSCWFSLGGAIVSAPADPSTGILAPAFIASSGCQVGQLDCEVHSVGLCGPDDTGVGYIVNHLFKLGAVACLASTRSDYGDGVLRQSQAENAMLAGKPLGQCYMEGVASLIAKGGAAGVRKTILLGDPALTMHVPSSPVVAPANHVVTHETATTDILTVNLSPTLMTGTLDKAMCDNWGLPYPGVYRGTKPGLCCMDVDAFYVVRQTITRPVSSVVELDAWPTVKTWVWGDVKLGMMGQPAIDYQQDGTHQLVWALRTNIMDWPSSKSTVPLAQMTSDRFRITYDLCPDITSFNANLAESSAGIQSLSDTNGAVVVYVPTGATDAQIAALAPTYKLDLGATCNQPNKAIPTPPLSARAPVSYIVTPEAGSSQPPKVYAVTVVRTPFTCAAWTGDADSGITGDSKYTVAVNCGGDAVTVNGVAFQASALSGTNFSISGADGDYTDGAPGITGNSLALASDFIYDGNPCTVTLKNLTPGATYETTFFSYGFDAAPTTRSQTFASGGASRMLDQNAYGEGKGIRIIYRFVADASSKVLTIKPAAGGSTFHMSALANRQVSGAPPGGDYQLRKQPPQKQRRL